MGCLGTKPSKPEKFSSIGDDKKAAGFEYLNGNGNNNKMRRSLDQVQIQQHLQLQQHQARLNNTQIKNALENRRNNANAKEDNSSIRQAISETGTSTNIPSSDSGNGSATSNNLNFNNNIINNSSKNKNSYVAIFDYVARTNEDLSFKKGDILYINDENKLSNGWWWGRLKTADSGNHQQKVSGYIPSQYVAEIDSLESQAWYFGATKRMEAEKVLMLNSNEHGSFLIRISDGNNHAYSLSVRDNESVKHYRIRLSDDGLYYYITKRVPFATLSELVREIRFGFNFSFLILTFKTLLMLLTLRI